MTWMVWAALALLALAVLGLVAAGALLAVFAIRRETYPAPAAEAPSAPTTAEPLGGDIAADGSPNVQREQPWAGQQRIQWRASEGWIAYAEEQFDWHGHEHELKGHVR